MFQTWLLHSFCMLIGTSFLASLLAIPTSVAWARFPSRSTWISQAVVTGFLFVPLYVQAAGWSAGFGALGWYTVSQVTAAQNIVHGLFAVIWIHGMGAFPLVAWLLFAGMNRIPSQLEEASLLDGGFLHVVRVAWGPTLIRWSLVGFLLTSAMVAGDMLITNLYRVPTLTERCYLAVSGGDQEWSSWIGSCIPAITLASVVLLIGGLRFAKLDESKIDRESLERPKVNFRLESPRVAWFLHGLMWIATLLAIGLPMINLIIKAGWSPQMFDGQLVRSWSPLQASKSFLSIAEFSEEFGWTIQLVLPSSLLALSMAICLGRWSCGAAWRPVVLASLAVGSLALPGPVVSLIVKRTFESFPDSASDWILDRTLIAPIVALQFRSLPIAILPMMIVWSRWKRSMFDSVRLDGLNFWQEGWFFLQGNYRILLAIGILTTAMATAELSSYLLVLPAGVSPIAMRIFELLHYGVRYKEAGLSLFIAAIGMSVGWIAKWLAERSK